MHASNPAAGLRDRLAQLGEDLDDLTGPITVIPGEQNRDIHHLAAGPSPAVCGEEILDRTHTVPRAIDDEDMCTSCLWTDYPVLAQLNLELERAHTRPTGLRVIEALIAAKDALTCDTAPDLPGAEALAEAIGHHIDTHLADPLVQGAIEDDFTELTRRLCQVGGEAVQAAELARYWATPDTPVLVSYGYGSAVGNNSVHTYLRHLDPIGHNWATVAVVAGNAARYLRWSSTAPGAAERGDRARVHAVPPAAELELAIELVRSGACIELLDALDLAAVLLLEPASSC